MLESRELLKTTHTTVPTFPDSDALRFRLVQTTALVEIAEALTTITDIILENKREEKESANSKI